MGFVTDETISHYRITEKLGEGGMGVVYKAEDTKLERPVALKFLSPLLNQDAEVRKRFDREAKAAAALSHPNVCTVHEIDEEDGRAFIAMEFVEGESIDKKIERGPLKLDDALHIADQIAKGLEAAHKKNIYHRDIKPQNVIVGDEGHAKVMDFGLAQLADRSRLTRDGTTLGTVAYMSPEQTEGAGTDQRTDIWSLGVVIYEMITGRLPFQGDYNQAIMFSILHEEPEPMTALRTDATAELERIVNKCLAKKPAERYQAATDLIVDLQAIANQRVAPETVPILRKPAAGRNYSWAAAAALATLVALGVSGLHFSEPELPRPVRKFDIAPEDFHSREARPAVSPNGEHIAYTAGSPRTGLWLRTLSQTSPRRLEGTDGAMRPFWSPDSKSIGFVAGGSLKRIDVSGGPAIDVCRLPGIGRYFLADWRPDGESIVFASRNPTWLFEVSARGGEPRVLVERADSAASASVSSPRFLSNRMLLYRRGTPGLGRSLVSRDLETGEEKEWPMAAGAFTFSRTGHILYQSNSRYTNQLWALPFSADSPGPSGDPFLVADDAGWPSVTDDGLLVYQQYSVPQTLRVSIVDRSGKEVDDTGRRWNRGSQPTFSPDGRRLIVALGDDDVRAIWLHDLKNRNWTRLNTVGFFPVWAPRGNRVAFSEERGRHLGIPVQSAEPSEPTVLLDDAGGEIVTDWNGTTGRILYYRLESDRRDRDLWYLEPDGQDGYAPKMFLSEPFNQRSGAFSPDGDWVAYVSDQEGPDEVYLRKFPEGTPVYKVSRQGGDGPRWRRDGKELFFLEGQVLIAVDVTLGGKVSFGQPRALFSDPTFLDDPLFRRYDVAPDGRTFAVVSLSPEALASPPVIRVVENWYEEFRDREQN